MTDSPLMLAPSPGSEVVRQHFTVTGVVQGVGFRPFVYRLARQTELSGWVRNDAAGVLIHVEGPGDRLERFRELLPTATYCPQTSCRIL